MKLALVLIFALVIGGGVGVAIEDFTRFNQVDKSSTNKIVGAIFGVVAAIIVALMAYFVF
ncbi:MAG: hypothetical protein UW28_C0011G0008 [Parcubacteria group bacterium GW2011_GWA2_44_13]|nr:MAG: hypothetical protein UW28_C0011G0008 [Parcubacteria group bacterium GW2011_GWA2_44_13]